MKNVNVASQTSEEPYTFHAEPPGVTKDSPTPYLFGRKDLMKMQEDLKIDGFSFFFWLDSHFSRKERTPDQKAPQKMMEVDLRSDPEESDDGNDEEFSLKLPLHLP